jgi:hypothetical protein
MEERRMDPRTEHTSQATVVRPGAEQAAMLRAAQRIIAASRAAYAPPAARRPDQAAATLRPSTP